MNQKVGSERGGRSETEVDCKSDMRRVGISGYLFLADRTAARNMFSYCHMYDTVVCLSFRL